MKFIMSLIALAALSMVTSAFAQEEETPSPTPSEEEPASATVEENPAATATPAEEPDAQKKEEPAAQKKEEPAAQASPSAAKKEKTTAAPAKAASPAAAPASGKKMSTSAALKEMENNWAAAYAKHDAAPIDAMVANDFVGVNSKGKVQNKRSMLAEVRKDKDTYTLAKAEKLDVRTFSKDVAVVIGTAREKGTGKDGKAFDRTYRFTDTWMSRNGKWQCIASQVSILGSK